MIKEGITKENGSFKIDLDNDSDADIISTTVKDIYISKFKDNTYYFGYRFNDDLSRADRTTFINWLKSKHLDSISPELEGFIVRPLRILYNKLGIDTIDAIISPKSNTSDLVKIKKTILLDIMPRYTVKSSFELVKNLPSKIEFDWELFNIIEDVDDHTYEQIYNYIENELMPKIHNLDYFSIAKNVKPKYRRYIKNYLKFESEQDEKLFKSITKGNILIIDDINTTGSTLNEILKIINFINSNCNVYIFTLIGK